jgi:hypothetical protein
MREIMENRSPSSKLNTADRPPLLQIKHSRSTTSPPFLLTLSLAIHLSIRHRDNRTVLSTTATTTTDTGVKDSDQQLASPCPGRQYN